MKKYLVKKGILIVMVFIIVFLVPDYSVMANEVETEMKSILVTNVKSSEDTSDDVIEISTEEELKAIANNLNGNYRLTNDIKLSGKEWKSIGCYHSSPFLNSPFTGTFDGAGYTISNLTTIDEGGFFEYIGEGAVVKNLTIKGKLTATDGNAIALLAGVSEGMIRNCITEGSINLKGSKDVALAGMICTNAGDIRNCINKVKISQKTDMDVGGVAVCNNGIMLNCENQGDIKLQNGIAGGVVSVNYGTVRNCENKGNIESLGGGVGGVVHGNLSSDSAIINCINRGNILVKGENSYESTIGGITGSGLGFVYGCINYGDISVTSAKISGYEIGGVGGSFSHFSNIIKCKNYGNISTKKVRGYIAGICGEASILSGTSFKNDILVTDPGEIVISECENFGEITAEGQEGWATSIAGIVSDISTRNGKIVLSNCKNNGDVLGVGVVGCAGGVAYASAYENFDNKGRVEITNVTNKGNIRGEDCEGVFGSVSGGNAKDMAIITHCVNYGDITGKSADGIGGTIQQKVYMSHCYNLGNVVAEDYANGLLGFIDHSSNVENCYNIGKVEADYVSGIVYFISPGCRIRNVYNAGILVGKKENYGILSDSNGKKVSLDGCYYLEEEQKFDNNRGTKLTLTDMQKKASYVGFDFKNVWGMKKQNNMMLPYLKEVKKKTKAKLTKNNFSVEVGKKTTLKVSAGDVNWFYSGNVNVLSVDGSGKINTYTTGETEIYAVFSDGQVRKCKVSVKGKSISKAKVILDKNIYVYDGTAKYPNVTIVMNNDFLNYGTDYDIEYINNINLGTATVKIIGRGQYSGEINKKFKIKTAKNKIYTVNKIKYMITNGKLNGKGAVAVVGTTYSKKSKQLKSLEILDVVEIGGQKFKITAIGEGAFENYSNLTSVVIGKNIVKVGKNVFLGAKKLENVQIKGKKLKQIEKNAWKNISSKAVFELPASKYNTYKKFFTKTTGYNKKKMKLKKMK